MSTDFKKVQAGKPHPLFTESIKAATAKKSRGKK